TGGGTLSGLSASVSYTSGSGWLGTPSLNPTTAPATLTVQPNTTSLAVGTYMATVSVSSGVASNSPQTVSVTFVVAPSSDAKLANAVITDNFSAQYALTPTFSPTTLSYALELQFVSAPRRNPTTLLCSLTMKKPANSITAQPAFDPFARPASFIYV